MCRKGALYKELPTSSCSLKSLWLLIMIQIGLSFSTENNVFPTCTRNVLFFPQVSPLLNKEASMMKFDQNKQNKQFPHCILGSCCKKVNPILTAWSGLWSHGSKGYNKFVFINLQQCFLTKPDCNSSFSGGTPTELCKSQNFRKLFWIMQCQ